MKKSKQPDPPVQSSETAVSMTYPELADYFEKVRIHYLDNPETAATDEESAGKPTDSLSETATNEKKPLINVTFKYQLV